MNIQGPLLLLGMTATTGVGLGTVAVNSGAIDIEDVSGLLANTTNAVSGPVAGAANPFGQAASPDSPQITATGTAPVLDTSLAQVATDAVSAGSTTTYDPATTGTSSGTSSGTSHGTSSGSTGGSSGSNSGNNSGAASGTNNDGDDNDEGYEDREDNEDNNHQDDGDDD
jgi:hypothetical protein